LVPREHVIDGPGQLLGQHGERFARAVFAFQLGEVLLAKLWVHKNNTRVFLLIAPPETAD
jgi:hypothetical protein